MDSPEMRKRQKAEYEHADISSEKLDAMSQPELTELLDAALESMTDKTYDAEIINAYLEALDRKSRIPEYKSADEAFDDFQLRAKTALAETDGQDRGPSGGTCRIRQRRFAKTALVAAVLISCLFCGMIAAQAMGWVTAQFGHGARMWLGAALGLLSVIVAFTLQELPTRRQAETAAGEANSRNPHGLSTGETVKILVRNKCYLLLLAMNFLLFLGYSCVSSFIPVLTEQLGGGSGEVGTVFALNALAEVPAMFLMSAVLRKVPAKKVILFAAVFFVLRLGLTALSANFTMMLLVQLLQGFSFAVIWPASMGYLNQIVEDGVRSTAIMTYSSVTLGVSAIFGNLFGTLILSAAGDVRMVFGFSALVAGLGLMLGVYGMIRKIWK